MPKTVIKFNGLSVQDWANKLKVRKHRLYSYTRRGHTLEHAIAQVRANPNPLATPLYTYEGKEDSLQGWACSLGLSEATFYARVRTIKHRDIITLAEAVPKAVHEALNYKERVSKSYPKAFGVAHSCQVWAKALGVRSGAVRDAWKRANKSTRDTEVVFRSWLERMEKKRVEAKLINIQ